jgi:hypothetical protein
MAKTDNHNPKVKLDLRRYFLNKYHAENPPSVFDCCQGSAVMWTQLQKEFAVANYWGVDLKPKKGRLKIDSVRILQQPGWSFDVIDVDTYGEPWKHWLQIVKNANKATTIFLTIAVIKMGGGGNISNESMSILGIDKLPSAPQSFCGKMSALVPDWMLAKALEYSTITEAVEAVSDGNARYIGVRFEPIKSGLQVAATTGKPKQSKAARELSNV